MPGTIGSLMSNVTFANQTVPNSPFKISVGSTSNTDASKVKVHGPAIENTVPSEQQTYFVVDCKDAGLGESVRLLGSFCTIALVYNFQHLLASQLNNNI